MNIVHLSQNDGYSYHPASTIYQFNPYHAPMALQRFQQNLALMMALIHIVRGIVSLLSGQQEVREDTTRDDVLRDGRGDTPQKGGEDDDILRVSTGHTQVCGSEGDDTAELQGSPSDYDFSTDDEGNLVATHCQSGNNTVLIDIEQYLFSDAGDKSYSANELLEHS